MKRYWLTALFLVFQCFGTGSLTNANAANYRDSDLTNEEVVSFLDEKGISVGKPLWLRGPMKDYRTAEIMAGLSKLYVKDIRVNYRGDVPGMHVEMICNLAGVLRVIELSRDASRPGIEETLSNFYLTDPSKQVAKWGRKVLQAIEEQAVVIGMTAEQAKASWGFPSEVHRSAGSWGLREQWVYGSTQSSYLYFENNRLVSWQN